MLEAPFLQASLPGGRDGYRALNLDILKSAGERAIANWLIKCGVDFDYERPYEVDVADAQPAQYRPDFFYPLARIYTTTGRSFPATRSRNLSPVTSNRRHGRSGCTLPRTNLIETAARDFTDGTLFDRLERQLRANGIVQLVL